MVRLIEVRGVDRLSLDSRCGQTVVRFEVWSNCLEVRGVVRLIEIRGVE